MIPRWLSTAFLSTFFPLTSSSNTKINFLPQWQIQHSCIFLIVEDFKKSPNSSVETWPQQTGWWVKVSPCWAQQEIIFSTASELVFLVNTFFSSSCVHFSLNLRYLNNSTTFILYQVPRTQKAYLGSVEFWWSQILYAVCHSGQSPSVVFLVFKTNMIFKALTLWRSSIHVPSFMVRYADSPHTMTSEVPQIKFS